MPQQAAGLIAAAIASRPRDVSSRVELGPSSSANYASSSSTAALRANLSLFGAQSGSLQDLKPAKLSLSTLARSQSTNQQQQQQQQQQQSKQQKLNKNLANQNKQKQVQAADSGAGQKRGRSLRQLVSGSKVANRSPLVSSLSVESCQSSSRQMQQQTNFVCNASSNSSQSHKFNLASAAATFQVPHQNSIQLISSLHQSLAAPLQTSSSSSHHQASHVAAIAATVGISPKSTGASDTIGHHQPHHVSAASQLSSEQCNEQEHEDRPNCVQLLKKLFFSLFLGTIIAICWVMIIHTLKWVAIKGNELDLIQLQMEQLNSALNSASGTASGSNSGQSNILPQSLSLLAPSPPNSPQLAAPNTFGQVQDTGRVGHPSFVDRPASLGAPKLAPSATSSSSSIEDSVDTMSQPHNHLSSDEGVAKRSAPPIEANQRRGQSSSKKSTRQAVSKQTGDIDDQNGPNPLSSIAFEPASNEANDDDDDGQDDDHTASEPPTLPEVRRRVITSAMGSTMAAITNGSPRRTSAAANQQHQSSSSALTASQTNNNNGSTGNQRANQRRIRPLNSISTGNNNQEHPVSSSTSSDGDPSALQSRRGPTHSDSVETHEESFEGNLEANNQQSPPSSSGSTDTSSAGDDISNLSSNNNNNNNPSEPSQANSQQHIIYKAPFFTSWFVSTWNILFMPVFTLISSCCFRTEDSTTKKLLVESISQFMDNGLTTLQFLGRCALFSVLWIGTIFGIVYSLSNIDATVVMALFACSVALAYLLSWVLLHQQFVGVRIVAVIICTTGIALLAYMDNSRTLGSVLIVAGSALCSAVYKVIYQRMFGFWSIAQMSLFFTLIGLFNAFIMWPVVLLLYLLGLELIVWAHIPWMHLTAAGALHLTANIVAYFGPICSYDVFLTLGLLLAVALSAVIDVTFYKINFFGMKLAGVVLLMIGFLVCLLPENWNEFLYDLVNERFIRWKKQRSIKKSRNKVQDLSTGQVSRLRTPSGRVK